MNGERGFRVLLLAMPDVASCFDRVMRFPNLGLPSLAAQVADQAQVSVLDLVAHSRRSGPPFAKPSPSSAPTSSASSAMTFQYDTAKQVAALVRQLTPQTKIVLGGYHATLAYEEIASDPEAHVFDFLVRGEGEEPFRRLVKALRTGGSVADIPGLSYRTGEAMLHPATSPACATSRSSACPRGRPPQPRLSLLRPPLRCRRDLSRMHEGLRLLLHPPHVRPRPPHLPDSTRDRRHSRRRGRGARGALLLRRQHQSRAGPPPGVVPRHRQRGPSITWSTSARPTSPAFCGSRNCRRR